MKSSNLGYSIRAKGKKEMKKAIAAIKQAILLLWRLIGLFRGFNYRILPHIYTSTFLAFFRFSLHR